MTRPAVPGWQVVLSDLALILFLTTLAALHGTKPDRAPSAAEAARSGELAVFRERAGGLTVQQWLDRQAADPRAQVTVLARFAPGDFSQVTRRAQALAQACAAAGKPPRLVIEPGGRSEVPGGRSEVIVSLAYDAPAALSHAHSTRLRPVVLAR